MNTFGKSVYWKMLSVAPRRALGQGLIESACGTMIFVLVFVFLIMLAMNLYTIVTTDTSLKLIAQEAAKVREDYTFFLGQKRNDITEEQARKIATDYAVSLAHANGLAVEARDVTFNDTINADQSGTECSIKLRALKLPFMRGGVFPLMVQREASVVVSRMNVPVPAIVDINAKSRENGDYISFTVPCYGAYRGTSIASDRSTGRFALDRPKLFGATNVPGMIMPSPVKHRYYMGCGIGDNALIYGPISNGKYLTAQPTAPIGQKGFILPR
jgi:hypothetical protein